MSTNNQTMNIVLPYCGEAEGIDQQAWLERCFQHKPSQLRSRLVIISASTCDIERYRAFTQRAKEIFDEIVEVVKYKPSPNNFEEAHKFASYCFMTAWPRFKDFGAGVYIDPQWLPKENYWADNYLAKMRIGESFAIALGIKHEDKASELSGSLGYSSDFFNVFRNYSRFVLDTIVLDRIAWEFKKFGYHASSDGYPFEKADIPSHEEKFDVFAKVETKPEEPELDDEALIPTLGVTSKSDLLASLSEDAPPIADVIEVVEEAKPVAKKTAKKKIAKKKRSKRRTKAEIEASK